MCSIRKNKFCMTNPALQSRSTLVSPRTAMPPNTSVRTLQDGRDVACAAATGSTRKGKRIRALGAVATPPAVRVLAAIGITNCGRWILAEDFRIIFLCGRCLRFGLDPDVLSTTDVDLLHHARTNGIFENGGGGKGPPFGCRGAKPQISCSRSPPEVFQHGAAP